jgi:hypothetical protein
MGRLAEIRNAIGKRLFEAITGTALGDWGTDNDPQLQGYRRLTGTRNGKLQRDLSPLSQESQAQVAHYLHTSNPMAKWCIDQRANLIVGGELGYSIEFDPDKMDDMTPERAKELAAKCKTELDAFWDHPAHSIRFRGREYLATFMVTGELCLVMGEANETNGLPSLDYVDSQRVRGVLPLEDSSMVPGTVLIEKGVGNPPTPKRIVRYNPEQDRLDGECFYWRNGLILNAMRGQSELLAPADFLDSLDQFMFSQVDRALLQNQVVWDLRLEGASETDIKARIAGLRTELAKPGGIFGHNEKGTLVAASPSFGAYDAGEMQRVLANHIRGSMSLPESWYSEGGNANRSTAGDQTDVAYKTLEAWQTQAKRMFNMLLWYAYDSLQAKQEGAGYPKRSEGAVTLSADLTPVRERDMGRAAETAVKLQPALEAAVLAEMLSKRTARKVWLQVVEKISGTGMDPDDEEAQIEAERAEREKDAAENANAIARDKTRKALADGADGDGEEEDAGTRQPAGAAVA